jgi:O-methyltransferase involved in polyketide biosynthesis
MDEERASRTAEGVATERALHQTLGAEPKILNDSIAVRLADPSGQSYKAFVRGLEGMPPALRLRRRGYAVMRSRYTEDCLVDSTGKRSSTPGFSSAERNMEVFQL